MKAKYEELVDDVVHYSGNVMEIRGNMRWDFAEITG